MEEEEELKVEDEVEIEVVSEEEMEMLGPWYLMRREKFRRSAEDGTKERSAEDGS